MKQGRDHGGGIDAAMAEFGGERSDWLDLSTGINPEPYPMPDIPGDAWCSLPDRAAMDALCDAARTFWHVPDAAAVLPCHGASAAIARIPGLTQIGKVRIDAPTYNEHAAAFRQFGWQVTEDNPAVLVAVHPNNPDGRLWRADELDAPITVIDESFCDVAPNDSHINRATIPGTLILKSFGKFWGLAGLRLGFVIGDPDLIGELAETLGPWSVSGPALSIGTSALNDVTWADTTREQLAKASRRLDDIMSANGAHIVGGTTLFRLYETDNATTTYRRFAENRILSRIFPYSETWIRLGLPANDRWDQLEAAL